jgi:hypothetical protein
MPGFPRPFGTEDPDEETFDEYDEFRPDHLPEPGPFLDGGDVLTGEDHAEFHRLTRDIFEERVVGHHAPLRQRRVVGYRTAVSTKHL